MAEQHGIRDVLVGPDEYAHTELVPDTAEVILVEPYTGQIMAPFSTEVAISALQRQLNNGKTVAA